MRIHKIGADYSMSWSFAGSDGWALFRLDEVAGETVVVWWRVGNHEIYDSGGDPEPIHRTVAGCFTAWSQDRRVIHGMQEVWGSNPHSSTQVKHIVRTKNRRVAAAEGRSEGHDSPLRRLLDQHLRGPLPGHPACQRLCYL
jgi:hypothetical protein